MIEAKTHKLTHHAEEHPFHPSCQCTLFFSPFARQQGYGIKKKNEIKETHLPSTTSHFGSGEISQQTVGKYKQRLSESTQLSLTSSGSVLARLLMSSKSQIFSLSHVNSVTEDNFTLQPPHSSKSFTLTQDSSCMRALVFGLINIQDLAPAWRSKHFLLKVNRSNALIKIQLLLTLLSLEAFKENYLIQILWSSP